MAKTSHAPKPFVNALHKDPVTCPTQGCPGPVDAVESSPLHERIKSFDLHCEQCGWSDHISGREQLDPPWDDASLFEIIDEHLLHLQPVCPYTTFRSTFSLCPAPDARPVTGSRVTIAADKLNWIGRRLKRSGSWAGC